jgi:hypothetical protein
VGWIQTKEPLIRQLRWAQAKIQAQESDLDRMNQKLVAYPKERVLELEQQLESLRSKTLWKE